MSKAYVLLTNASYSFTVSLMTSQHDAVEVKLAMSATRLLVKGIFALIK